MAEQTLDSTGFVVADLLELDVLPVLGSKRRDQLEQVHHGTMVD